MAVRRKTIIWGDTNCAFCTKSSICQMCLYFRRVSSKQTFDLIVQCLLHFLNLYVFEPELCGGNSIFYFYLLKISTILPMGTWTKLDPGWTWAQCWGRRNHQEMAHCIWEVTMICWPWPPCSWWTWVSCDTHPMGSIPVCGCTSCAQPKYRCERLPYNNQ